MRNKSFPKTPSQLEQMPSDRPIVFISYSWDNEEHKKWVAKLSEDLRKNGIYTLLDQYNHGGEDLIKFMKSGLEKADRVLIIGTPSYKKKIGRNSGGAKFEDQVITIQIYKDMGTDKFIPILRKGKFLDSFSDIISERTGYDMSKDEEYENTLENLVKDLWGYHPIDTIPALGPKPKFMSIDHLPQPNFETHPCNFSATIKTCLSDPNKRIHLTELIEKEREETFKKILQNATYDYLTTNQTFEKSLKTHLAAIEKIMSAVLPLVRYGNIDQQKLLVDAMVKFCIRPYTNGEVTIHGTEYVHLLSASFLYHATGVASIKYGCYKLIKLMMETKVPSPNVLSIDKQQPLEYLAGCSPWDPTTLNKYLQSNWIYPYSRMIIEGIKPYFNGIFIDDNDFNNCFYIWEHMASLLCNYYNYHNGGFPVGEFVIKSISIYREEDFYTDFFKQAWEQKAEWAPIKYGLFGGNFENYNQVYTMAKEFYHKNRH